MPVTDAQVRKLMEEMSKDGRAGVAAMKAGMDRKTARRYARAGQMPSQMKTERTWRTRDDPFAEQWPEIVARLEEAPELEGKALFEDLLERHPERYEPGHLRTFQRRVKQWRAQHGPEREVYFAQLHRPGEAMQTDFTWATELEVTLGGEAFVHMMCHPVLPYSNWEWATVCQSESMSALRRGVQQAVFRLGRIPEWHQTDNSTAATHELSTGKRGFNAEYAAFIAHLGMKARTIGVGKSEQNGDVESLNGALKRRLKQHLLLRRSRDFASVEAYEEWLWGVLEKGNRLRTRRLREDLEAMRPLVAERMPEYTVVDVPVSTWSTIRVKRCVYSVPSRLMREQVRVHVYDERLEVYYGGGPPQLQVERLRGESRHRIDYRHVIWSLVRKPGAFARYRYREELFPAVVFRRAYDALSAARGARQADIEYLRILHLAASTMQCEVEAALEQVLEAGGVPDAAQVKARVQAASAAPALPELSELVVDLSSYDGLLAQEGA